MINNTFTIIGTAVSGYVDDSTSTFSKKKFSVEVEVINSRISGKTSRFDIVVYANNKMVNTTYSILGKQVVVNGYIDCYYNQKTATSYISLVCQSILVIDTHTKKEAVVGEGQVVNANDDDLPF